MNKLVLALAAVLALGAAPAFAKDAMPVKACEVPANPCVKPASNDSADVPKYESCMAAFMESQKTSVTNHQEALNKAEAAMEEHRLNSHGNK